MAATSTGTARASAEPRHEHAVRCFEEGRVGDAEAALLELVGERVDAELLNDLGVVLAARGRTREAAAVLECCLLLDPARPDAAANLQSLRSGAQGPAAWRGSATLGGDDPSQPERAYPGMQYLQVMAEHAQRYAFASLVLAGRHVLDLGCGTGYGSEMLTWTAASVRGFDLWRPAAHELPSWPGGALLTYGHDLCLDPLPRAEGAVMFEVIEHLVDAPAALAEAWRAVDLLVASFPNPVHHGSHSNPHHVNDWSLDEFEQALLDSARTRFFDLQLVHFHQGKDGLLVAGRDPGADYWVVVAAGVP